MPEECLFCKIVTGKIPATKVYEDDRILAFRDIAPASPTHILVIPKVHYSSLKDFNLESSNILGELLLRAKLIAEELGFSDFRTVINTGAEAGQTVFHLHVHLLAGRAFQWPPG